jgi:cyclase
MFRPRVIPVLLLKNKGLVKTVRFDKSRYIGDPINAVRIFNDHKADELAFLDILASKENRLISIDFVRDVGEEANMPFSVGGGIKSIDDIRKIINAGAEKVIINSFAAQNPDFISAAADAFGSSTIVVCIDVKKKIFGGMQTYIIGGSKATGYNPLEFAQLMQEKGAGEIIIQSIEKDGMMDGYDIELIINITSNLTIPVIALGGAGNIDHLKEAYHIGKAGGLAAGSMFVYHGSKKGVLINYPEKKDLQFYR